MFDLGGELKSVAALFELGCRGGGGGRGFRQIYSRGQRV